MSLIVNVGWENPNDGFGGRGDVGGGGGSGVKRGNGATDGGCCNGRASSSSILVMCDDDAGGRCGGGGMTHGKSVILVIVMRPLGLVSGMNGLDNGGGGSGFGTMINGEIDALI